MAIPRKTFGTYQAALTYITNKLEPPRGMEVRIMHNLAGKFIVYWS